jgi:hypothetical protein
MESDCKECWVIPRGREKSCTSQLSVEPHILVECFLHVIIQIALITDGGCVQRNYDIL